MQTTPTITPSWRVEREFGLLVGTVFVLLGSWWLYRGHWQNAGKILVGLGGTLALLGLCWPRALVQVNRAWQGLAHALSFVTTPIVLGAVYFLILMPVGIGKRLSGWDPLRRRAASATSYWVPYNERQLDPHHFERMY